jgi:hypothetical protein
MPPSTRKPTESFPGTPGRVPETLAGFRARPLTTVGTSRDTEAEAFIEGGAMSDPMTSLRDRTGILGAALEQ